MIRNNYGVFYAVTFVVNCFLLLCQANELHDKCLLNNGEEGICTGFHDCPGAKKLLGKGIFPTLCSQDHVCCDLSTSVPSTEGPEVNNDNNSAQRDSKMLETITCLAPPLDMKSDYKAADTLIYSTSEEGSMDDTQNGKINFLAKVGIRKTNGDAFFYCGAVLLTSNFVLAPAHCMLYKGQTPEIVQIGSSNSNSNDDEKIPISKIHTHPGYNNMSMYNDLALLELVVPSGYVPVCALMNAEAIGINTTIIALGHDLQNADQLQVMSAELKPNGHCSDLLHTGKLPFGLEDEQLCVANSNVTVAEMCKGFIGSPLLALNDAQSGYYLIGLATFVQQCYSTTYPMIYLKLNAYQKWLNTIIY